MALNKQIDEVYCSSCGKTIKQAAAICVHCGVPNTIPNMAKPKKKSTAVALSILIGIFTWVYTWEKDAHKFWINLVITLVSFGIWGIVAWVWAMVDAIRRPGSFYANFPNE